MLDHNQLIRTLQDKQSRFTAYDNEVVARYRRFRKAMGQLGQRSRGEVESLLAGTDWPGATPTNEYGPELAISYGAGWQSYESATRWAAQAAGSRPLMAIDGSQIWAERDLSVPVAVVQAGWYENRRQGAMPYEKRVVMDLLAPDELTKLVEAERGSRGAAYRQIIALRRHTLEVERLTAYIEANDEKPVKPVCIFDGPLVLTYVDRFSPRRQQQYVEPLCRLLLASEKHRVPVFGYIDNSDASDLVQMMAVVEGWDAAPGLSDAWMLNHYLAWGDRSQAYLCAREGILAQYRDPEKGRSLSNQLCFIYLQPEQGCLHPPARLEFPRWMLESGELEEALKVVLADAIYGDGYPYTMEAADEVAVLSAGDWDDFYLVLQRFLHENVGVEVQWSRKRSSKRRRR